MGFRVKEFEIQLTTEFYLLVRIESLRGRVSGFVVLLIKTGERHVNLVPYDTAHGQPHRDLLGKRAGLLRKDWLEGVSLQISLKYAIDDLKANYERYDQIYQKN